MNVPFSLLSKLAVSVDVCYTTTDGATIKSISENVVVNPGDEAKLSCAVDGKFVGGWEKRVFSRDFHIMISSKGKSSGFFTSDERELGMLKLRLK
jgi:hypothetical protein